MSHSPLLFLCLTLLVSLSVAAPKHAGIQSTLSKRGISHISKTVTNVLQQELKTTEIPKQKGKVKSPVGKIKYELKDISIQDPHFGKIDVTPDGKGLELAISDVSCKLHMKWKWKRSPLSDSGKADVKVSGMSMTVSLDIEPTSSGGVTGHLRNPHAHIHKLKIKLHGGASWLYKIFVDIFSHQIKKAAKKSIESTMKSTLNQLIKKSLSTVDPIIDIDHYTDLDFRLMKAVFSSKGHVSSHFNGNLLEKGSLHRPNLDSFPMPDLINDQHLQLFIGQYALNSAGYLYHLSGVLQEEVTDDDIPESSWIHLNTNSWRYIIPQLYQRYPDTPMEALVATRSPPSVRLNSTGLTVSIPVIANVSVAPKDGSEHSVFSLGIDVVASTDVWTENGWLKGNLGLLGFKFGIISSEIGNFDTKQLNKVVDNVCKYGILPFLNVALEKGIEIPVTEGIEMKNPTIQFGDGFIAISTDVDYHP
ncbi:hypothetical protein P9112_006961 [Eukaryota sp. TZLM1-RC]